MIRNNKKLFYKYFDYARVSQFIGDESAEIHAKTVMRFIKENSDTDLLALSDEKHLIIQRYSDSENMRKQEISLVFPYV